MFTRTCEYIDSTKDGRELNRTEHGFLNRMDVADKIGAGSSTGVRQVIWTQDGQKNQRRQAGWCDREDYEYEGKHGILRTSTGECRWPFNVVPSIVAGTATTPFMYARTQGFNVQKKGIA